VAAEDVVKLEPFPTTNGAAARRICEELESHHVLSVALVGPPGAGKTAVIEATARQLRGRAKLAIIVANPAAERDADRVSRYCNHVEAIKTHVPDAPAILAALSKLNLSSIDLVIFESAGGITGVPHLGQDQTVTVLSVAGGDDKAAEYDKLVAGSSVVLLSKADLQRHVLFDKGAFRADVRKINPDAQLMELSAFEISGLPRWIAWLDAKRLDKRPPKSSRLPSDLFVG
jgi:hydrogenase nickel incorporation protein HypB